MIALQQWLFERFKLFFCLGLLVGIYKITETCACTAQMYGINIPFIAG
ncbi:MAG: hypothetical protein KGQ41_04335 [Alphaproteobacteria bacterium]|nr:hypothetical protein [Alphaproteobacteria bacterium]